MSLSLARVFLCVSALAAVSLTAQDQTPQQAFINAMRSGDLNALDNLLMAGFNPNTRDGRGQTPLYFAVLLDNTRAIRLLLAWHADPNAPLTNNRFSRLSATPLQYAAREGDTLIANMLTAAGARIDDLGAAGRSALHFAVEGNRLDTMRLLIDRGAGVNQRDSEGASPLDDAVWRGYLDAAAILLAHGAHIDDPDTKTGATPINEAAFQGNSRMVRYLLQFRPDITIADKNGYAPLANAIRMTDQTSALLLLEAAAAKQQLTPAYLAAHMDAAIRKDEARVTEALVARGIAVNAALPSGLTPLDAAASTGAFTVAEYLLEHSADPNLAATSGATPLEDSALKGFDRIAKLLLDHGAQADHINSDSGSTALYAAASFGQSEVVQALLDRHANPNLCGANRKTPLTAAIGNGYELAAAEIRNQDGRTVCAR